MYAHMYIYTYTIECVFPASHAHPTGSLEGFDLTRTSEAWLARSSGGHVPRRKEYAQNTMDTVTCSSPECFLLWFLDATRLGSRLWTWKPCPPLPVWARCLPWQKPKHKRQELTTLSSGARMLEMKDYSDFRWCMGRLDCEAGFLARQPRSRRQDNLHRTLPWKAWNQDFLHPW